MSFTPTFNAWQKIIYVIGNNDETYDSMSQLSKDSDITYSHVVKVIEFLDGLGLVSKVKPYPNARKYNISLTKEGEVIYSWLYEINERTELNIVTERKYKELGVIE
jgi:DNA-binding MarR family transcriptional regulator